MIKKTFGMWLLLCAFAFAEDLEPRVLWDTRISGIMQGSAAVADGQIFAPILGGSSIVSLEAATGKVRWTRALKDTAPFPPVIDQEAAYVITGSCTLYKLSRADGKVLWSRWLAGSIHSMPTLANGKIYAAANETFSHGARRGGWNLLCIDAAKGKEVWSTVIGSDILGAPLVTGGKCYVATHDGVTHAYDLDARKVLWTKQTGARSMPVLAGDWLVSRSSDGLAAINRADGTVAWNWTAPQLENTKAHNTSEFQFVMISGSHAFVTTSATDLTCINLGDQSTAWTWSGGEEQPGEPVMVGGRVYFGTSKGTVWSLQAKTGKAIWALPTEAAITGAPTIMDGAIYFHDTKGGIVAVDAGTKDATGWSMWGGSSSHTGAIPSTQPPDVITPSAGDTETKK